MKPTPQEATEAYREGQAARPGSPNPYAGRIVLGALWWRGYREATLTRYAQWRAANP